ncbi:hypothetical protein JCM10450v2_004466 [Rhodotorula kratochvilovae]
MPPKRRPYGRKGKEPNAPPPVFYGPEPPPPPAPPTSSTSATPAGAASEPPTATPPPAQDGARRRRKKLPRKKFAKDSKGGWEDDHVEREPHDEDEGRYDADVPYDLRLLRCCDEFRSLRSLGHLDRKVNYEAVLRYFQANIPLRGYDPDQGVDDDPEEEDEEDDDDGGVERGELLETKIEEIVEKTEDEWAGTVFALSRLAKFFDNRANDNYTPTLWLAPQIMTSFLRFMIARNVFPKYQRDIQACIKLCGVAAKQLYPANLLFKQVVNTSLLVPALSTLFPSPTSTLASPIAVVPDPVAQPADPLPDTFSAVSIAEFDSGDDDEEEAPAPPAPATHTWPESKLAQPAGDQSDPADPEAATRARLARLQAQFERDARVRAAWEEGNPRGGVRSSSGVLRGMLDRLEKEWADKEGTWRVGHGERCARTLQGWELVSPGGGGDGDGSEAAGAPRMFVRLHLGAHEPSFPLTASHDPPPATTLEAVSAFDASSAILAHTPDDPLDLVLDLDAGFSPAHLDALCAAPPALLEADLTQLVFVPSPLSTATPSALWLLHALHRVLPGYWPHGRELLRDEPGRVLDFPGGEAGGYEESPAEALERIEEEREAEGAARGEGA